MKQECDFCTPALLNERIAFQTEQFYTVATLGQIVPGYSLIIPKIHKTCLGDYSRDEIINTILWLNRVASATTEIFQPPIIFEHGDVGQSIKHAHLHIAPTGVDLLPEIQKDFDCMDEIEALWELKEIREAHSNYLLYINQQGKMFVFPMSPADPRDFSQYFRKKLARTIGEPESWNWRKSDPEEDKKRWTATRDLLKEKLLTLK